jgi:hypothetical protein
MTLPKIAFYTGTGQVVVISVDNALALKLGLLIVLGPRDLRTTKIGTLMGGQPEAKADLAWDVTEVNLE